MDVLKNLHIRFPIRQSRHGTPIPRIPSAANCSIGVRPGNGPRRGAHPKRPKTNHF
ncbi:MAG: hypothetical protein IJP72_05305 [Bacteroidales bacterium]|nr:hypothetical protein [Bacteroidales bacterium]